VESAGVTTDALAELRAVIADLRQGRDQTIADLRRERDEWREQAQRLALPKPEPEKSPMSWWRWLRTTG
jgi:predicted flap endonuclease-1-like 5' DNA nuclease